MDGFSVDDHVREEYEDASCSFIIPSNSQCKFLKDYGHDESVKLRQFNLVLDLDQTLIHTIQTCDPEVIKAHCMMKNMLIHFVHERPEPLQNVHFMVFYRPGVFKFLEEMSQICTLHIYTNAVLSYANKIINMIHASLGTAVIRSYYYRESMLDLQKHLSKITSDPCDTIVIDDRLDVWLEDMNNVIQIRPFLGPAGSTPYLEDNDLYLLAPIITKIRNEALKKGLSLVSLIESAKVDYLIAQFDKFNTDKYSHDPISPATVDFLRFGVVSASSMYE